MPIQIKNKFELILALALGLLVALVGAGSLYWQISTIERNELSQISTPGTAKKSEAFSNIVIEGKSAYVFNLNTGEVLFSKNENDVLPLASITKIMTAFTAYDMAPKNSVVTIDQSALAEYGDSGLVSQEKWQLPDLLKYTLVVSSNDGAAAVAAALENMPTTKQKSFTEMMNENAKRLGLSSMTFNNESGLDVSEEKAGGYGSAKDVALLMKYALLRSGEIIEPTKYESYTAISENNISHTALNTDLLAGKIPGLIAGKTGWSDLAGGNLAIIFNVGMNDPVVAVVLGSSYDGRFSDIETLVKATYLEYNSKQ